MSCSLLFSASTDKTVGVWDSETGERIKRLKGHTSFVNTCYPARRGPQLICTGSDDGTVKVRSLATFQFALFITITVYKNPIIAISTPLQLSD